MKPEILSPAGSYDAAVAAFQYGADAIYLGLQYFSARAEAQNISLEEFQRLCAYAKSFAPSKRIYITVNTLILDGELKRVFEMLDTLGELNPDGVIVQDLGVARLIREQFSQLPMHASTQLAAHNLDSVLALKEMGFKRVVLARELSISEIEYIVHKCGIEIEVFVHGALCYSYSGLCLFSARTCGRSGNRGHCAYCCRHSFSNGEESSHPFSMKDLALLPILDKLTDTGVHSLKIEGRMKNPLYVAGVTSAYRKKVDGMLPYGAEKTIVADMQTVFSRPWTQLYAESTEQNSATIIDSETIGHRGAEIGRVISVFKEQDNRRWLRFKTSRELEKHDGIQIDIEDSVRPFGFSIRSMHRRGEDREQIIIPTGTDVEIEIIDASPPLIKSGAKVYCASSLAVQRKYSTTTVRASELDTGIKIDISVSITPDELSLSAKTAHTAIVIMAKHSLAVALEPAKNPDKTEEGVKKACTRLGNTAWSLNQLTVSDEHQLYLPPAILNNSRRELIKKLDQEHERLHRERAEQFEDSLKEQELLTDQKTVAEFTLKTRLSTPRPDAEYLQKFTRVVIDIEHLSIEQTLEAVSCWNELISDRQSLILAMPLITRLKERNDLEKCINQLIELGFRQWEIADLAGFQLLKSRGVTPVSADWTLYCLNRLASEELHAKGLESQVISPELVDMDALYPDTGTTCAKEYLIFQHTPLYISATAPLLSGISDKHAIKLTGRDRHEFITYKRGSEWITTEQDPLDREDQIEEALRYGISRFRIDWSWSAG